MSNVLAMCRRVVSNSKSKHFFATGPLACLMYVKEFRSHFECFTRVDHILLRNELSYFLRIMYVLVERTSHKTIKLISMELMMFEYMLQSRESS